MAARPVTSPTTRRIPSPQPTRPAPCCEPVTDGPVGEVDPARHDARVALVGNPNVGKSTLFNAVTGARQHVGNWPGKTVHVATGTWRLGDRAVEVVDLPGTYSLLPQSPDEELTRDLLVDRGLAGRPDLAVVVVDASNLARNLYLLAQVLEAGVPVVVALTMVDVAAGRGIDVDAEALGRAVGVPVVPVVPRQRRGCGELAAEVAHALSHAAAHGRADAAAHGVDLGQPVEAVVADLGVLIAATPAVAERFPARWLALELLTEGPGAAHLADLAGTEAIHAAVPVARRRLIEAAPGDEPALPGDDLFDDDAETVVAERRYAWVHGVVAASVRRAGEDIVTWSDRIDRVLTSRLLGLPVFLLVMWGVFEATTRVAAPLQSGLQSLLDGPVGSGVGWLLTRVGIGTDGWVGGLVLNGLVAGVGQLLTFVPLMAIMFVLLALLEDSGYMARAAFVVDRFMRLIGLPGRAFLPLIVGFGCNVPAIAGTRILSDTRQRLLTSLLVPYVTCSARLTVYVLLANVFFGSSAGTAVFAMYVLSIALIILIGLGLRRTLFRGHTREPLVLELPAYRRPTARVVGLQTWQKLAGFLKTAGGIIVLTVTAVWLLSSIPVRGGAGTPGHTPVEQSLFGATARTIAPAFAPAGYGDWHASAALMTGFVAKEAVVATFAQTYSAAEPSDVHRAGQLGPQLVATFTHTSGGHTAVAVLAFMVFLLAYTPCMATVAAQRAEIGTRWTLVGMGIQLAVAWLLSVLVFQVGSLLW
ncbi:ferrous iron transport protein B [Planosporangium thailandense]|uniref:Ferrous iron transport protein B n=1 Tax=Planosporangium thailandense TaxID=765197 RepID=A0ABX0Y6H0_9ACTN|nr:ferrous iron transport protein B [Planosporangium thailandense]NJC73150.1 ferrous iron transport protein B [Planosporangium thailandense]